MELPPFFRTNWPTPPSPIQLNPDPVHQAQQLGPHQIADEQRRLDQNIIFLALLFEVRRRNPNFRIPPYHIVNRPHPGLERGEIYVGRDLAAARQAIARLGEVIQGNPQGGLVLVGGNLRRFMVDFVRENPPFQEVPPLPPEAEAPNQEDRNLSPLPIPPLRRFSFLSSLSSIGVYRATVISLVVVSFFPAIQDVAKGAWSSLYRWSGRSTSL